MELSALCYLVFLGWLNMNIAAATVSEVRGAHGEQYQRRLLQFYGYLEHN